MSIYEHTEPRMGHEQLGKSRTPRWSVRMSVTFNCVECCRGALAL